MLYPEQRKRVIPTKCTSKTANHCLKNQLPFLCSRLPKFTHYCELPTRNNKTADIDQYVPLKLLPELPGSTLQLPRDCLLLTVIHRFHLFTCCPEKTKTKWRGMISVPSADHYDLRCYKV